MFGDWIKKGVSGLSSLFSGGNNNNQQAQADAQRQADLAAQRQREEEERRRREEAAAEARRKAEEQARIRQQQQEAARRQQEQSNLLRTPTSLNVNQTTNRNTAQANMFGNINSETNQRELDLRARSDELYKNTLANEHNNVGVLERLFGQKDINQRAYNQARSQAIREQAENLNYQDADATNRLFKGVQDQYNQYNRRVNDSKDRQQIWQNSLGTAIDTYKDTTDRLGRGSGDIILGQDDNPDQVGLKDIGRFIVNLPGGIAGAPISATTKIAESFLDKDYNFNAGTGDYDSRDLTAIQRAAKIADAGVDIYGLKFGGSGTALNSLSLGGKQALKQGLRQGFKGIGMDALKEGGEELTQSLLGDLGDNGGFDEGTLPRAIKSGLLGAAGGGVMSGFGSGVSRLRRGNQDVQTDTGRPSKFMTQGAVEVNPQTDPNDSDVPAHLRRREAGNQGIEASSNVENVNLHEQSIAKQLDSTTSFDQAQSILNQEYEAGRISYDFYDNMDEMLFDYYKQRGDVIDVAAGEMATGFDEAQAQGLVFDGVDGKPRFEVDDSGAKLNLQGVQKSNKLGDILQHPQLFEQYPELKSVPVELTANNYSSFDGKKIELSAFSTKDPSTLLHEIQHAIQSKEGFAFGGGDTTAGINAGKDPNYRNLAGEAEARAVQARMDMPMSERYKQPKTADEYAMSHRPDPEGATLDDISQKGEFVPEDVYDNPQWYGDINDAATKKSVEVIKKVRNNPEAEVTVYRAAPQNELNHGDWVSLSKGYAQGESNVEGTGVHSFKVKAKELRWPGDSFNEFGYFPDQKPRSTFYDSLDVPKEDLIFRNGVGKAMSERYVDTWDETKKIIDQIRKSNPNIFYENSYFEDSRGGGVDRGYARYIQDNFDKLPKHLQDEWAISQAFDQETGESIYGADSIRGTHVMNMMEKYDQIVESMINEADNIQTNDPISQLGAEQPTPAIHTASPSPETGGIYGDTQQSPNISETLNETIGSATTDNTGIAAQRLQQAIKGSVNQDIKKQSYNAREVAQAVNEFYDSTTPMEAASALAGLEINGANDILAANELIQRLEKDNMTLKDPAIREAILAAADRISKKSSNAGSDLRATAEFHQNLPTELWIENVKRNLAESGQALTPDQEVNLKSKKDTLKAAAKDVKTIYRSANKLANEMGSLIKKGKMTEDMLIEYNTVGKQLADAQQAADRALKIANDSLNKDLRKTSKNGAFRKSVDALSNGYRTLLLSSPSGRLADIGATLLKSVDKLASSTISNKIGKVANKINPEAGLRQGAGAGTAEAFTRGAKRGGQRLKDIITNKQNPDARMGETIGGVPGRLVKAMTETAPALTEGATDVRLLNTVRGELKAEFPNATNKQLDSMARIVAIAERGDPTSGAFNEAQRYHNEINMTGTDNVISKNVDKVINKMEKQPALKAIATLTAPFARFSANSAYQIARRNPVGDLVALGRNLKDGNTQGVVDNVGELAIDSAKLAAYAVARGAGALEDEDNDGQTYESNYIKWNDNATSPLDRIAVSDNTNATLGKSISDLQRGSDLKDVVGNALGETVNDIPGRVFDNMTNNSVARALGKLTDYRNSGGENLENTVNELSKLFNPVYNPNDTMKVGDSDISVPFASSPLARDIRTGIDSKQSFGDRIIQNPARSEATQNRKDNEKSAESFNTGDWFTVNATETKKDNGQIVNKQTIVRNDGKDPSFKGDISNLQNHMKEKGYTADQINDTVNMLSMTKNEVLKDFETNGSQNAVRRYANAQLEALRASDGDTIKIRDAEKFLKLAEVNEEYDIPVELQKAYNSTSLTDWRAMEKTNPEMFTLLYQYGQVLAEKGITKKSSETGIDGVSDSNSNKYYAKKASGGSRGGSGSGGKGISTDVGTIKVDSPSTNIKSRSASGPKSYIPGLQKLNQTPKLKKITVKRGFNY